MPNDALGKRVLILSNTLKGFIFKPKEYVMCMVCVFTWSVGKCRLVVIQDVYSNGAEFCHQHWVIDKGSHCLSGPCSC